MSRLSDSSLILTSQFRVRTIILMLLSIQMANMFNLSLYHIMVSKIQNVGKCWKSMHFWLLTKQYFWFIVYLVVLLILPNAILLIVQTSFNRTANRISHLHWKSRRQSTYLKLSVTAWYSHNAVIQVLYCSRRWVCCMYFGLFSFYIIILQLLQQYVFFKIW